MLRKERKWKHIKCSAKTTRGRKRTEDKSRNKQQGAQVEIVTGMIDVNFALSVTTLSVNSSNAPRKRHRLSE